MNHESRLINRELSWLEFNQRVLDEASDPSTPLLEQINFLAIAASNLDEFFMVRVGGLKLIREAGISTPDPSGMRPAEQLSAIHLRTRRMTQHIAETYQNLIVPSMTAANLCIVRTEDLTPPQMDALRLHFKNQIFPVITPAAIHPGSPIPLLSNLALYIAVMLAPAPRRRTPRFALIPIPACLSRFVLLPIQETGNTFLLVEDVIHAFVGAFFPGQEITGTAVIRATRNADVHVDETFSIDLSHAMRKVLRQRKTSGCVRLEMTGNASPGLVEWLKTSLALEDDDISSSPAPLQLGDWREFYRRQGLESLRYPLWTPQQNPDIDPLKPMVDIIAAGDTLLSLPYERFDPVGRMVEEAAEDPDTLGIKMVLYRINAGSPIIEALRKAAHAGKAVTVLIELKARFDEANNMEWAARLERNGVQVIYGIKDLKTHAKICMVVRRETEGIVRYMHFGTGNYNMSTARLYTDVGLFTRNDDLGMDASAFFNAVCGFSEPQPRLKISQAPIDLRERLLELIDAETAAAATSNKARIVAKMNALVDPDIIEALYRASTAGVKIDLLVRGTCCLRPGVPGMSENIRVISIIDRFLEHSRIFMFHHGGGRLVFISSADWMPRNLSRRIELMVPVEDRKCRDKLIAILKTCLDDSAKGRHMKADGSYARPPAGKRSSRSQERLFKASCHAVDTIRRSKRTKFEPHRPPS